MKTRNIAFASLAFLVTGLFVSGVSAFSGFGQGRTEADKEARQTERTERRAEMDSVFETGDFEAWKTMMTERHNNQVEKLANSNLSDEKKDEISEKMTERYTEMTSKLTTENFVKVQKMHTLMEEVKVLRDELGFSFGEGKGERGHGFGNGEKKRMNGMRGKGQRGNRTGITEE